MDRVGESRTGPEGRGRAVILVSGLVVVLFSFACFVPALYNGLLGWDDESYTLHNPRIHILSIETVRWAFTEFHMSSWTPLTQLSLALDYAFWGVNPVGYHLTNNLIHSLNAGLFFLLCLVLARRDMAMRGPDAAPALLNGRRAIVWSIICALLFALHPLRVESVAWVAERKDVLSTFFGLLSVLAYLRHVAASSSSGGVSGSMAVFRITLPYGASLALYGFSLLSKPMLVTLPLVLLVVDWFPLRRVDWSNTRDLVLEKLPYALFAVFASVMTMRAQGPITMSLEDAGLLSRMLIAFKSISSYLWLMVWPVDISPFYLHPMNATNWGPEYVVPILFFMVATACAALLVKRLPVLMTAWLIYLITLIPVLGFVQVGAQAMAARYTYVPSLPITMLGALGMMAVVVQAVRFRMAWVAVAAIASLLAFHAFQTVRQIPYWKDDVALWSRVIDLKPHSTGRAYFQRGHAYAALARYPDALADMNEALEIALSKQHRVLHPIYAARGGIRKAMGDLAGAVDDYGNAIRSAIDTKDADLPMLYRERGTLYREMGRPDLADEDFRLAAAVSVTSP